MPDGPAVIVLAPGVKAPSSWRRDDGATKRADMVFSQARKLALRRARGRCQGCAGEGMRLEVHHCNNDHGDNSLENLAALCRYCHAVFHAGFHASEAEGAVRSRWYLADHPIDARLQAEISRWGHGMAPPPLLPKGDWMSSQETMDFIGHLEAEAEGRHPDPAVPGKLKKRAVWVPVYPDRNYTGATG